MEKDFTQGQSVIKEEETPLEGINLVPANSMEVYSPSQEQGSVSSSDVSTPIAEKDPEIVEVSSSKEIPIQTASVGSGFPLEPGNLESDPWSSILFQKANHEPAEVL